MWRVHDETAFDEAQGVDGVTDLTVEQVSACLRCGKGRMVRSHGLLSSFWRHYQTWLAGKCLFSIGESSMNWFFFAFPGSMAGQWSFV